LKPRQIVFKKGRYPGLLAELAESFDIMIKVEVREFRLKRIIDGLEKEDAKREKSA
jgi:hypothetical protein